MKIKLLIIAILIVAGTLLALREDSPKTASCLQTKQEFETVANITNATGQLPDGQRLPHGGSVSVNPELCKVSFDAPVVAQREARELQGNTSNLQNTVNSQQ